MYVCLCVYLYVYIYAYMYMYMYIWPLVGFEVIPKSLRVRRFLSLSYTGILTFGFALWVENKPKPVQKQLGKRFPKSIPTRGDCCKQPGLPAVGSPEVRGETAAMEFLSIIVFWCDLWFRNWG